jgi:hypothetical protein
MTPDSTAGPAAPPGAPAVPEQADGAVGVNGLSAGPAGPAPAGPAEAEAAKPDAAATRAQRAEALVDNLATRIGEAASFLGRHLLRFAARVREEAEDLWAEAQVIRKGKAKSEEEKAQEKP